MSAPHNVNQPGQPHAPAQASSDLRGVVRDTKNPIPPDTLAVHENAAPAESVSWWGAAIPAYLCGICECIFACFFSIYERIVHCFCCSTTQPVPDTREELPPPPATPAVPQPDARSVQRLGVLFPEIEKWKAQDLWQSFNFPCAVTAVVKVTTNQGSVPSQLIFQKQYERAEDFTRYAADLNQLYDRIAAFCMTPLTLENAIDISLIATHINASGELSFVNAEYLTTIHGNFLYSSQSSVDPNTARDELNRLVSKSHPFSGVNIDHAKLFYQPRT